MKKEDLKRLKTWFSDYCSSFYTSNKEDQKNIILKEQHTLNVCDNILAIADSLSLDDNMRMISEVIALFHDVGRFPQYATFRTFKDSISVNHGKLGVEVIEKNSVLKNLSSHEKRIIINSVRFHNSFLLPDMDNETIFFLKMIRDADKLDIWRVFAEIFSSNDAEIPSAAGLGLPDIPEYSSEIVSCIHDKKIATLSLLKTMNDFKLMQLSWIYDLNFSVSFMLISERGHLDIISSSLPQTEEIHSAIKTIKAFIRQQLTIKKDNFMPKDYGTD